MFSDFPLNCLEMLNFLLCPVCRRRCRLPCGGRSDARRFNGRRAVRSSTVEKRGLRSVTWHPQRARDRAVDKKDGVSSAERRGQQTATELLLLLLLLLELEYDPQPAGVALKKKLSSKLTSCFITISILTLLFKNLLSYLINTLPSSWRQHL